MINRRNYTQMANGLGDANVRNIPLDFSKIRIGTKTIEDAVLNLGEYKRINPRLGDKR